MKEFGWNGNCFCGPTHQRHDAAWSQPRSWFLAVHITRAWQHWMLLVMIHRAPYFLAYAMQNHLVRYLIKYVKLCMSLRLPACHWNDCYGLDPNSDVPASVNYNIPFRTIYIGSTVDASFVVQDLRFSQWSLWRLWRTYASPSFRRWRQIFCPERQFSINGLYGIVSQKIELFEFDTVTNIINLQSTIARYFGFEIIFTQRTL
jgi:hypothetical protein